MGIIFTLTHFKSDRIVNDWISGRQKPGATRMQTERLKRKVGLYQITKTKIYTNSNNGLNFLIEKDRKLFLICNRAILEFLNVDFISV